MRQGENYLVRSRSSMQFINSGGMFNHYRAKSEGFFLNMHVKD